MKLRFAEFKDYDEIVKMYKELIKDVYYDLKISDDIFFHGVVLEWFKTEKDLIVCETDSGDIAGFTLSYIENMLVVEPYYFGDIAYVKLEYRKTRCAYLLYNNVVKMGKELGLRVVAKAFVGNGNKNKVDKIQSKFGYPKFVEYISYGEEK